MSSARAPLLFVAVALAAGLAWTLRPRGSGEALGPEPGAAPLERSGADAAAPAGLRAAASPAPRAAAAADSSRAAAPAGVGAPTLALRFVSAADGRALPEVAFEVWVDGAGPGALSSWTGRADAQGAATLAVVAGAALVVWVEPTDEHGDAYEELAPLDAGARAERTIALACGTDLVWYCRVESGGRPVAGARVEARRLGAAGAEPPLCATETDAAGLARVEGSSWRLGNAVVRAAGVGLAAASIEPGHASPATAEAISLAPVAALRAVVVDADGAPLEGLRVEAQVWPFEVAAPGAAEPGNDPLVFAAHTDADGTARLADLAAGRFFRLRVLRGAEVLLEAPREEPLPAGGTSERRYAVAAGGGLVARVVDATGAPRSGVEVWLVGGPVVAGHERELTRAYDADHRHAAAVTDAEGRARFEDLPLCVWAVGVAPPEERAAAAAAPLSLARTVELSPAAPRAEVLLELVAPLAIAGRVVDEQGAGIPGCALRAWGVRFAASRAAETDADGAFRIAPLLPGPYLLQLESSGGWIPPELGEVPAGREDLEFVLRRGGALRGAVRDAASGALVEGAVVCAFALESARPAVRRGHQSSRDGRFEIGGLDDGRHALLARTDDGRLAVLPDVRVARPDAVEGLELRLAPGVPVRVRYAGDDEDCAVRVTWSGATLSYAAYAPGQLETFTAPPGRVAVEVELSTGARPPFDRELRAGEEAEIVIE